VDRRSGAWRVKSEGYDGDEVGGGGGKGGGREGGGGDVTQFVSCSIAGGRGKERLDQVREVVNGQLVPRTSRVGK
jgi:hypothetical protein